MQLMEQPTTVLTVRLPVKLKVQLKETAKAQKVSFADLVREVLGLAAMGELSLKQEGPRHAE